MRPRRRRALAALAALLVPGALLARSFAADPLPAPPPLADTALPPASPPDGMALVALPTGTTHRSAAFAYRGGSLLDRRDFAMTAVLVQHPRGDLLIDTGFGRDIDAHFGLMPLPFRLITRYTRLTPAADQLRAAGHDAGRLKGILLTHAHWDHVSGVPDFPGVPVWLNAAERAFIAGGDFTAAVARSVPAMAVHEYTFDGGPYLGFARSHDVHGDGSVVLVPAPGHTPGSIIVFVALPGGQRHAFVGDLAWQREGITEREERPWLQRTLADGEPAEVRANLLRMAAVAARFPAISIVPAHDARGFAALPTP